MCCDPMHKHNRKFIPSYLIAVMFVKVLSTLLWLIHQFISIVWISWNEKRIFFPRNSAFVVLYPISIWIELAYPIASCIWVFVETTITTAAKRNCKSFEIETTFIHITWYENTKINSCHLLFVVVVTCC